MSPLSSEILCHFLQSAATLLNRPFPSHRILFRTQDISLIKEYCLTQWTKLKQGNVSIQDFTLAKEVKLGSYSDKGPPPPGVMVASRRLTEDPRAEAEYGERVPYVIAMGESHRLVDRAVAPEDLLNNR